jgi:DNA-binding protein HU-beta
MTKAELASSIAEQTGLSKVKSNEIINVITSTISKSLTKGDKVTLVGFGTFTTSDRSARQGRNPKTGEIIDISAKRVAKFKPSSSLNETIN